MNPVTIQEAVKRGLRTVSRPAKIVMIVATVLCVMLLVVHFSWWYFLLLPGGVLLSLLYTAWAAPRWRIWAYEHVTDIHQLQRSADLAGVLMRQSHERIGGLIGSRKRAKLKSLQKKNLEEPVFADDAAMPDEMSVYYRSSPSDSPALVLCKEGIKTGSTSLLAWDSIDDERIATVTYEKMDAHTGADRNAGSDEFFRFESGGQRFEIALSSLDIDTWELDLLLYIYKGRFNMEGATL